jgi:hypothetical protein
MKRALLQQLLQDYNPIDQEEQLFKQQLVEFVEQHENCFERSLEIGHVTASAWLVNNDNSKALLMHHTKLDRWFQLGGHCIKKAQEESGITTIVPVQAAIFDIDIHVIPEFKGIPAHYHYDVRFLLQVKGDDTIVQNSESKELRWIAKKLSDLPTDNPSVVPMFKKWATL